MGLSSLGLPPTPPTLPTAVPCPGARWWPAQCSSPGHPVLAALSHLKLLVPQVGTRVSCVVIHRHERPGEESESPACVPAKVTARPGPASWSSSQPQQEPCVVYLVSHVFVIFTGNFVPWPPGLVLTCSVPQRTPAEMCLPEKLRVLDMLHSGTG